MKAFFIGLLFLIFISAFAAIGMTLFPLFIAMGYLLQVVFLLGFIILCIWLLGRLVILVWEKYMKK